MIKVAVSGFFNPPHYGHLKYLEKARKHGNYLIVIVASDRQVKLKGSVPFMSQKERLALMKGFWCVDKVMLAVDKDRTVCQTLRKIQPDIYCVGADHSLTQNLPEAKVCKELGIKLKYKVGGRKKLQSSSKLIKCSKKYLS